MSYSKSIFLLPAGKAQGSQLPPESAARPRRGSALLPLLSGRSSCPPKMGTWARAQTSLLRGSAQGSLGAGACLQGFRPQQALHSENLTSLV